MAKKASAVTEAGGALARVASWLRGVPKKRGLNKTMAKEYEPQVDGVGEVDTSHGSHRRRRTMEEEGEPCLKTRTWDPSA